MRKIFACKINEDVLEKFQLALQLNKEDANEVLEKQMMQYIANSFSKASQIYREPRELKTSDNDQRNADTGKARVKIPKWALKSGQMNHKIVRAFLQLEDECGVVTLNGLEKRCSNEIDFPTTYVKTFGSNFSQMKFDSHNSHGKVFEVHNGEVIIWEYVKDTIMDYKSYFCR